MAVLIFQYGV